MEQPSLSSTQGSSILSTTHVLSKPRKCHNFGARVYLISVAFELLSSDAEPCLWWQDVSLLPWQRSWSPSVCAMVRYVFFTCWGPSSILFGCFSVQNCVKRVHSLVHKGGGGRGAFPPHTAVLVAGLKGDGFNIF